MAGTVSTSANTQAFGDQGSHSEAAMCGPKKADISYV